MVDEEFGPSEQPKPELNQTAQRSYRPVEKELSDQLQKLLVILKDVKSIYFSGSPPDGGGDYFCISLYINANSALIRAARTFMYVLPGLYIKGQICFKSKALRYAVYAFCDGLRNCYDPAAPKLIDEFERIFKELVTFLEGVRMDIEIGRPVDDLYYSDSVMTYISNLIKIISVDVCEVFSRRESEIRDKPGRSYRRPSRGNADDGFTEKDRAMLKEQGANTNAILYITSGHEFGIDPKAGSLVARVRHKMAEDGLEIILNSLEGAVSCQKAADQIITLWAGKYGAYTQGESGSLRKAIERLYKDYRERKDRTSAA